MQSADNILSVLKNSFYSVFGEDVLFFITNYVANEVEGYFFKKNNEDFKLHFTINEKGNLSIDLFFDVLFNYNKESTERINSIENIKHSNSDFYSFVNNLTTFFNTQTNNSLKFFLEKCYLYKNSDSLLNGKNSRLRFIISEEHYNYDFSATHYLNNNKVIKIDLDRTFISFQEISLGTKSTSHSEFNLETRLSDNINRLYSLEDEYAFKFDFLNPNSSMDHIIEEVEILTKIKQIMKY